MENYSGQQEEDLAAVSIQTDIMVYSDRTILQTGNQFTSSSR